MVCVLVSVLNYVCCVLCCGGVVCVVSVMVSCVMVCGGAPCGAMPP